MEQLSPENKQYFDVLIIGAGVSGLNCALHLPEELNGLVVCKAGLKESYSDLAQ